MPDSSRTEDKEAAFNHVTRTGLSTYFATEHVLQGFVANDMILLDLVHGEYIIFDEVATAMWQCLTSDRLSLVGSLTTLQRIFNAEPSQLERDLSTFLIRCLARGWLRAEDTADYLAPGEDSPLQGVHTSPYHTRGWGWPGAWLCLACTERELNQKGLSGIFASWPELGKPVDQTVLSPQEQLHLQAALKAFRFAENFYISPSAPDDCLPRSLALFRFLRRMGIPAEHCLGFERFASGAHAWVECEGNLLLDEDRRQQLTRLRFVPH